MSKIHVYVDETGKNDAHFIVSAIIIPQQNVDAVSSLLAAIETESRRTTTKWAKSQTALKIIYFEQILSSGQLNQIAFCRIDAALTTELVQKSNAIALAIQHSGYTNTKAKIFIDGTLSRSEEKQYRNALKQALKDSSVSVDSVKGVRKTSKGQHAPIVRYADACCGLVRGATNKQKGNNADFKRLYNKAMKQELFTLIEAEHLP